MNLLWPTCGPYVPRISSHPFSRLIRTYAAWRGAPCHFSSLKSQSFTSAKDRNARARARHNAGNLWLITSDDVRIFLKFSPIAPIKEDVKRRRKVSSPPSLSLFFSLICNFTALRFTALAPSGSRNENAGNSASRERLLRSAFYSFAEKLRQACTIP